MQRQRKHSLHHARGTRGAGHQGRVMPSGMGGPQGIRRTFVPQSLFLSASAGNSWQQKPISIINKGQATETVKHMWKHVIQCLRSVPACRSVRLPNLWPATLLCDIKPACRAQKAGGHLCMRVQVLIGFNRIGLCTQLPQ